MPKIIKVHITGEQGAGKTTLAKAIERTIDGDASAVAFVEPDDELLRRIEHAHYARAVVITTSNVEEPRPTPATCADADAIDTRDRLLRETLALLAICVDDELELPAFARRTYESLASAAQDIGVL